MTRDELYRYIQSPDTLSEVTLPELRSLTEAYPYCATFIYLYLYNLALIKDLRYSQELRRLAIFLPDRQRLYREVEVTAGKSIPQSLNPREEDPFSLIDSFLSDAKAQGIDLPQELLWGVGVDRDDYFAGERAEGAIFEGGLSSTLRLKGDELPAERGGTPLMAEEAADLDEALFTETLAGIYIKQGRYDKALRMIHSISLNYPKKNRFFVQQIRFLERLIINK
ncbi:MAG: tetratricopeptide repeat protein [Porphyromonadaceae bacterium]|nr:tetratricopeptide repeat protein [Porphyromonadaceae bacterium]